MTKSSSLFKERLLKLKSIINTHALEKVSILDSRHTQLLSLLLDSHTLSQVTRLIDIEATLDRGKIGKELPADAS